MDKMGYDKGLIKYTTQNAIEGKPSRILRPRIIVYALILLTILCVFVYSFSQRTSLGLDVIRDRNRLYRETSDGLIENVYILKILNMDDAAHEYELGVRGIEGLQLQVDSDTIRVESGDVAELPVRLQADEAKLEARSTAVIFELMATDAPELAVEEEARFLGPR
jgi:polyferredoxin